MNKRKSELSKAYKKTVGFKQLFEALDTCDQYPVEKFSDSVAAIFRDFNHASNRLCHLDFSGIEQLTDEVFFILHEKLTTEQKLSVIEVDLTGCVHITDGGIRILAETFINIIDISLIGLMNLTTQSLSFLYDYCKELCSVKMDASGLSCLPNDKFPFQLSTEGCPVFNNLQSNSVTSSHSINVVNLVIFTLENCHYHVLHWLQTGEMKEVKEDEHILYSPKGWKLGDHEVNAIEFHCDAVCYSAFIQPRSLYLIAINLDEIYNPQLHCMRCIDYIRGEIPQAAILVVVFSKSKESNLKFRDLNASLEAMFKDQKENMEEHLQKEHYSRSVDKDFPNQKRYIQSIDTSRPENFMIHLLLADLSDDGNNKRFIFSILQETKLSDNADRYIQRWKDEMMNDAKDALDRVNKMDISEVLSLRVWPDVLNYVLTCSVIVLREESDPLNLEVSLREHLRDYRYIIKLQHFDYAAEPEPGLILSRLAAIPLPSQSVERVANVSRLGNAIWLWVKAIKKFYEDLAPLLHSVSQNDQWKSGENTSTTSVEAVRLRLLENIRHLISVMYSWLPKQMDQNLFDFSVFLNSIENQPVVGLHNLMRELQFQPYGKRQRTYQEALLFLSSMGRVLYFPNTKEHLVILDIGWFVKLLNHSLHNWKEPFNNDVVLQLPRNLPICERPKLIEFLSKGFKTEQDQSHLSHFVDLMLHLGVFLITLSPVGYATSEMKPRYISPWYGLGTAPEMRTSVESSSVVRSVSQFTKEYFPNVFSSDFDGSDVNVKFSVKFRIGMPSNLFPRIVGVIMAHCRGLCLWDQGLYFAHGTLDLLMKHNLHGTLASSSIDIEARTANVPHYGNRLVEYIWSVLSDYITIIEGLSVQYPNMHHKLRHYCRGECYKELSKENTFSPTEIARSWERNVTCSKCKRYQMSDKDWTYLIGRQFMFPVHAFTKPNSCDKCWRFQTDIQNIWNHQCASYPSFSIFCFRTNANISGLDPCHKGNLLISPIMVSNSTSKESHSIGCMRTLCPLKPPDFKEFNFLILQPQGVRLKLVTFLPISTTPQVEESKESEETSSTDGKEIENVATSSTGYVTNAMGEIVQEVMTLDLAKGTIDTTSAVEFLNGQCAIQNLTFSRGDVVSLCVVYTRIIDHNDTNESMTNVLVKLRLNHITLDKFYIPDKCHVLLEIDAVPTVDDQYVAGILYCPTFPLVTGRYFRPGMALLYKTGIGAMWNAGVVKSIERGKLRVKHADDVTAAADGRDPNAERMYSPWSEDLAPLGLYPDEMNAVVDTKHVKSMDNWHDYLTRNVNYSPAPYGLFPRLQNDFRYKPLPVFAAFSRTCTMVEHCPSNYLRIGVTSPLPFSNMTPVFPLPLDMDVKTLTLRNRASLQSSKGKALYQLCPGHSWQTMRDMHPLNVAPVALDEEEFRLFRQEYHIAVISLLEGISKQKAGTNVILLQHIDGLLPKMDPQINRMLLGSLIQAQVKTVRDDFLERRIMSMPNTGVAFESWTGKLDFQETEKTVRNSASNIRQITHKVESTTDSQELSRHPNRPATASWKSKLQFLRGGYESRTCESHSLSRKITTLQSLGAYNDCVEHVRIANVKLDMTKFPSEALLRCKYLSRLHVSDTSLDDMKWIEHLPDTLISLNLTNNAITKIAPEILKFKGTLRSLFLTSNPITSCPDFIGGMMKLNTLCLSNTLIESLPDTIGEMPLLRNFYMDKSILTKLPDTFGKLKSLTTLKLGGVPFAVTERPQTLAVTCTAKNWTSFSNNWKINGLPYNTLTKEEKEMIFAEFDERKVGSLTVEQTEALSRYLFLKFPRLCMEEDQEFPPQILGLKDLRVLVLSYSGIKRIPNSVRVLKRLNKLIVTDNPLMEAIEADVGLLNLDVISLKNCSSLKTPPPEIIKQGMMATIGYLNRLASGKVNCYRTKLMLVGLGGAGKTSLIRAFMNENHRAPVLDGESITDGIDITTWSKRALMPAIGSRGKQSKSFSNSSSASMEEQTVTYSVWDFAGQTLYYNTHQFFLTERAIYFLIWNIRQGYEHAGLEFWLNSIYCHAPNAPIFVVGTHADQVAKAEAPVSEMLRKFPSIVKFVNISCLYGTGISELLEDLLECTRQLPYIGEQIPEVWLKFERDLIGARSQKDYLEWENVKKIARKHAIYDGELSQVIRFLHDLGSIQHFDSELLRDYVIIKAQWLVDVMKCLVSVKNTLIKDGQLHHKDIGKVWKDYDPHIHEWLLQMTEIFDLTFPMNEQPINIVPCLLPHSEPLDLNWPSENTIIQENQRQVKMFYNFDYLPAGLFNRLQVRLCQYSDTYNIWQRGSLLTKNEHLALIAREGQNSFIVKVVGIRPENLLLVIHETFESLVEEAFRGVKYEYLIPCTKCLKQQVSEPHLFSSLILRRAVDLRTMVLQCHVHFHFLSVPELQSLMPSEQVNDYDKHFEMQMNDLMVVEDGLMKNLFIIFSHKDTELAEAEPDKLVNPLKLCEDLQKNFTVFYEPHLDQVEMGEQLNNMARAQVVLHLISDAFVSDKICCDLFRLSREDLRKPVHLAILGEGKDWQSSSVGVKITGDKYVNFQRINLYEAKLKELCEDISISLEVKTKTSELPPAQVFLSYCWTNSQEAVECGDVKVSKASALGFGDPRKLKSFLESHGIVTWIDKERMGASNVYSEICAALKGCKVVVACISDEYALSEMCRKEFLFAMKTLQMPMIIVVVGTTSNWESSELGFAAIDNDRYRINFQFASDDAYTTLLRMVRERIEEVEQMQRQQQSAATETVWRKQEAAFKEQYELLQRRLFRFLTNYEEGESHYPRIFVVDYYKKENKTDKNEFSSRAYTVNDEEFRLNSRASSENDFKENAEFCFKILCEHEGGWHAVHDGYPIDLIGTDAERLIHLAGPYLSRVSQVLKHRGTNLHFVLNDIDGARLMSLAEKYRGSFAQFEPIYKLLRAHLMSKDIHKTRGSLKRCHLPSGKTLWLCSQHQTLPRVTVIPDESETVTSVNQQVNEGYLLMSDVVDADEESQSAGNNPLSVDIESRLANGTTKGEGVKDNKDTGLSKVEKMGPRPDSEVLKDLQVIMTHVKKEAFQVKNNDKDVYNQHGLDASLEAIPNPILRRAVPQQDIDENTKVFKKPPSLSRQGAVTSRPFFRSRTDVMMREPNSDNVTATTTDDIQNSNHLPRINEEEFAKKRLKRQFSAPVRLKPTSQACHIL